MSLLYDPLIYDDTQTVRSYWEATVPPRPESDRPLSGAADCDVAIIGGGYTGLSAALHLARDHGLGVRLLESGALGWGASGRNGGFCCLAATKLSIAQLIQRYGLEETKRFYAAQLEGIDLVRELCETESIDAEVCGDGNLEVAHRPAAYRDLEDYAEALESFFGIKTTLYSREAFPEVGHDSSEQYGGLHVAAGFALHPLKFALGLAAAAAKHGAILHPHSRVTDWTKTTDGRHLLTTAEGGSLRAERVILATNGFTREGLHPGFDKRLLPALSNIITTRPLTGPELSAQGWRTDNPVCNSRNLLFYYRLLPDRSFLFGARGDTSGGHADGAAILQWMQRRLGEVFPVWRDVPLRHFWRGLVCVTRRLTPAVGQLEDDPSVFYGYGYHANGVNTAPWTGRALASLAAGANRAEDILPTVMAGPPAPFPLAVFRPWYLRGAYIYYHLKDDGFFGVR